MSGCFFSLLPICLRNLIHMDLGIVRLFSSFPRYRPVPFMLTMHLRAGQAQRLQAMYDLSGSYSLAWFHLDSLCLLSSLVLPRVLKDGFRSYAGEEQH